MDIILVGRGEEILKVMEESGIKDLPAGVVAAGNPCRVLRPIGPQDRDFYFRGRPVKEEG